MSLSLVSVGVEAVTSQNGVRGGLRRRWGGDRGWARARLSRGVRVRAGGGIVGGVRCLLTQCTQCTKNGSMVEERRSINNNRW